MPITQKNFDDAVDACGFPQPDSEVYDNLKKHTSDFSDQEMAMFLAQIIEESSGFQVKEELEYVGRPGHDAYKDDYSLPERDYHGRGYFQITWAKNYKEASEGLRLGEALLRRPHLVAKDVGIALQVSIWYWKTKIRPNMDLGKFGTTTKALRGVAECSDKLNERAQKKYQYYLKICSVLGVENVASMDEC